MTGLGLTALQVVTLLGLTAKAGEVIDLKRQAAYYNYVAALMRRPPSEAERRLRRGVESGSISLAERRELTAAISAEQSAKSDEVDALDIAALDVLSGHGFERERAVTEHLSSVYVVTSRLGTAVCGHIALGGRSATTHPSSLAFRIP